MSAREKFSAVELGVSDQPRRYSFDRFVTQLLLFFVSWCVTYNSAYVNGDDVYHLQGNYGKQVFLPTLHFDWIPNRVVDLYGRNLLVHLFDLVYFPMKSLFAADFFFVFKMFNATLFSFFLVLVHKYLMNQIAVTRRSHSGGYQNATPGLLLSLCVAFSVLLILPWINQVQFICYQLPAFVCFVVLVEIFKLLPRYSLPGNATLPAPWLMTLAFVGAFSLEAYSAIMIAAIALAWLLNWRGRPGKLWRNQGFIISVSLLVFCMAALAVTVLYSARPGATARGSPIRSLTKFFSANGLLSHDAKVYCALLLVGLVVSILLVILFVRRPHLERIFTRENVAEQSLLYSWMLFFLVVLFPTLVVLSLISLKTDHNYFSLGLYPWGGLLLIVMFFAVPAIAIPTARLRNRNYLADTVRTFVMALFITSVATLTMDQTSQRYDESIKVLNAFKAASTSSVSVFDTGLALDSIPIEIRPLPTAASPPGFASAYPALFKKYYGITTTMLFK